MKSHVDVLLTGTLILAFAGCDKPPPSPNSGTGDRPTTAAPTATAATTAQATAAATSTATAKATVDVPGLDEIERKLRADIPEGSGDYARALALATLHKEGKLSYEDLERAILSLELPPHKLGDAYLMTPVPKPPPPAKFDPKMMPTDWQGTWGEVAMAYWLGALDKQLYAKLHRAAHPDTCKHE
ncbi:MAG: hypothetical protein JRI23_28990 [Deltaproteobacteria bacterium]|nr:hypothetical protein [Deltaproteobacteria bacterium]MBW2536165.1 hypothetical protein [Deltaproteobacteria bacterium]